MELILTPHFHDPVQSSPYGHMAADAFYAELLQAHEGLSETQSALLDAKLVLLLANHVGDLQVLRAVLRAGAQDLRGA
jgi:predicted LPLAT superfamily acyltransferase